MSVNLNPGATYQVPNWAVTIHNPTQHSVSIHVDEESGWVSTSCGGIHTEKKRRLEGQQEAYRILELSPSRFAIIKA